MSFSANSSSSQTSEINVAPLIDVLLVLLIIFMVLVPAHPHGLDSSIPQGASTGAQLPPVTVQVVRRNLGPVHALGPADALGPTDADLPAQYLVDQHVVPSAQLQPLLQSMFAVRQDRTLIVQADRDLSYQQVAAVISLGRLAGAGQVSLARVPKA